MALGTIVVVLVQLAIGKQVRCIYLSRFHALSFRRAVAVHTAVFLEVDRVSRLVGDQGGLMHKRTLDGLTTLGVSGRYIGGAHFSDL